MRVLLDGADVTNDCRAADGAEGWVVLVQRDQRGLICLNEDRTGIAERIVEGDVTVQVRLWAVRREQGEA